MTSQNNSLVTLIQVRIIKIPPKRTTVLTGNPLPSHKLSKCVPTQIPHTDRGQNIFVRAARLTVERDANGSLTGIN